MDAVDDEAREQKKKTMHFRDVTSLAFGFKRLAKIDCLIGLTNLAKLQLDNNNISKIENLGHLVRANELRSFPAQLSTHGALTAFTPIQTFEPTSLPQMDPNRLYWTPINERKSCMHKFILLTNM